jgi:hypothetical protein
MVFIAGWNSDRFAAFQTARQVKTCTERGKETISLHFIGRISCSLAEKDLLEKVKIIR